MKVKATPRVFDSLHMDLLCNVSKLPDHSNLVQTWAEIEKSNTSFSVITENVQKRKDG